MSVVKLEHLTKYLKTKMKPGVHGSVLVHLKDGIVTGVKFHEDFNVPAFIAHVEKPLSRAVVRSCKAPIAVEAKINVDIVPVVTENLQQVPENDSIKDIIDGEKESGNGKG